jgi:hypothetical protein
MKKFLLLLVLAFTLTTSFAQDKVKDSTATISEAERIIDKYGGAAIEGFNNVVEKITPMAQQGFEIAVKLQIAKGVALSIPLILCLTFLIIFFKEYSRLDKILSSKEVPNHYNESYGPFDESNITPLLIVSLASFIIFTIAAAFTTYDAITHLVAPEWYAIKEIIELFQ